MSMGNEADIKDLTEEDCDRVGGARGRLATTQAIGEEDCGWCCNGPRITTRAIGEEDPSELVRPPLDAGLHLKNS